MNILMVIEIGKDLAMMVNNFPLKSGISGTYNLHTIMTGKKLDFKNQCRRPFGAYVQANNYSNLTNKIIDRNQGAI